MTASHDASFEDTMSLDIPPTETKQPVFHVNYTKSAWAWEFLRRNPLFRLDWRAGRVEHSADLIVQVDRNRQDNHLEKWGLIFRRPAVF